MSKTSRCPHWDSGWCYHPNLNRAACPGGEQCEWFIMYSSSTDEERRAELKARIEKRVEELMAEEKERGITILS